MIAVFVMIVLFTAAYGRIWCGWLCPQTVLMEMVFRKIEYWIEGDHHQQRKLNKRTMDGPEVVQEVEQTPDLLRPLLSDRQSAAVLYHRDRRIEADRYRSPRVRHVKGLVAMILFSLMFYGIFSRFREQACTFICPYGRFQSSLLDDNSIVVAYDHKRGEEP